MGNLIFKQRATIEAAKALGCLSPEDTSTLKAQNAELVAQLHGLLSSEGLQHDLIIETERAMRQRDEYLKTKISTASHGGSHDTCFSAILRNHIKLNEQCLRDVKAEAGRDALKALIAHSGCRGTDAGDLIDVSAIPVQDVELFADHYAERVKAGEK